MDGLQQILRSLSNYGRPSSGYYKVSSKYYGVFPILDIFQADTTDCPADTTQYVNFWTTSSLIIRCMSNCVTVVEQILRSRSNCGRRSSGYYGVSSRYYGVCQIVDGFRAHFTEYPADVTEYYKFWADFLQIVWSIQQLLLSITNFGRTSFTYYGECSRYYGVPQYVLFWKTF